MEELAQQLANAIRFIHAKGWSPGTGGNYSATLSRNPLQILMTPSGVDKGSIDYTELLILNEKGDAMPAFGKPATPSAEALIHLVLAQLTDAGAILHTHSVWNTLMSLHEGDGFSISGYEMLKALEGVKTHAHSEWVPILENSQDIPGFTGLVREMLLKTRQIHGFLMRGHGLYTWGRTVAEAKRHVEAFEFLFELEGRRAFGG